MKKQSPDVLELQKEITTLKAELSELRSGTGNRNCSEDPAVETQDLLRALDKSIVDAILILDQDFNVLYANESFYHLFEIDLSRELSSLVSWDYLSPEYHQSVRDDQAVLMGGEEKSFVVLQTVSNKGREFWTENYIRKIIYRGKNAVLVSIRDITERKKADESLRESEERYRRIISAVTDYIYTVNLEDGIPARTVHSPACEAITGYTPGEFDDAPYLWFDMVFPEDRDMVLSHFEHIISNHETFPIEHRIRRKDGEVRWVSNTPVAHRDSRGNLISYDGVISDITMRKIAEERLKESEERFRVLHEASFGGISIHDNGIILDCNQGLSDLTGFSREELIGMDGVACLIAPAWQKYVHDKIIQAYESPYDVEGIRKDGSVYPLEISAKQIPYHGKMVRVTEFRDMTERRRVEEAIRESEEKLRNIVENSTNMFYSHTIDNCVTYVSPQVEIILGYSPQEAFGKWTDFLSDNPFNQNGITLTERALRTGKSQPPYELELLSKDGRRVWVEVNESPLLVDGKTTMMVGSLQDITQRKLAEEALRISEERFKGIAGNLPGVVFQFYARDSGEMGLNYVSERSLEVLGIDSTFKDAFETFNACIAPEHQQEYFSSIMESIQSRSKWDFESRFIRPDGEVMYIRGISQPVRYANELVFNGVLMDITDRKRAELALNESRELYRSMFENNHAVMLLLNPETGTIVDANPAACSYYGYSRDDFNGMGINRINSLPLDRIKEQMKHAKLKGSYHFFFRHRLANGIKRDVEVYSGPVIVGGDVLLFSIVHDITERKLAEEALRRNEERFRSLVQNLSDIIIILNASGVIVYETPSVSRIMGYASGYLIGRSPKEFAHPDELSRMEESLKEVYAKADSIAASELRFLRADGSWIYLEAVGKNLLDFPGIDGVVVTARDITDRKKAEEERMEMERRFQHAQKLESLGVLAGGIAHDFNNLLMAIIGNLDLALTYLSPVSKTQHYINQSKAAARRAADLTNQMLAYSGKGKFDLKTFCLSDLVEEMTRLLKASISKTVTLNLSLDRNIPPMTADPAQLQQIIMNLIVNASEAIGDKAGVVSVSTGVLECDREYLDKSRLKEKPETGTYVYVDVKDTGCGMDEQTLERLFDPFFSTKFTGRGLGMAAVLGIVKGHRGAIIVESEAGAGTEIKTLFPAACLSKQEACPENASPATAGEEKEVHLPKASGTVLVVDDEDMVLDLCCAMIERLGYPVIACSDGREALEVFRKKAGEIACVILDLTMPRMDGISTFEALLQLRSDIRVIISSGFSKEEVAMRFQGKAPAGFIKKPFEYSLLKSMLARVLKKS